MFRMMKLDCVLGCMSVANRPVIPLKSALVRLQFSWKTVVLACPSATDWSKSRSKSSRGSIRCSENWSTCVSREAKGPGFV